MMAGLFTKKKRKKERKKKEEMNWFALVVLMLFAVPTLQAGFFEYISTQFFDTEYCNTNYVRSYLTSLHYNLRKNLYGQHIVIEELVPAFRSHFFGEPQKALVICMHGWTGGGKSYATKILIDAIYKNKEYSAFVHYFNGRLHFPLANKESVDEYKINLQSWIQGNLTICPRSFFIFDEVDKMPPGVIDGIKPFLDYTSLSRMHKEAIYIFISNLGGDLITSKYLQLWESGVARDEMQYKSFEPMLRDSLYYKEGGFEGSAIIDRHLISLHLPFLPLEKEHIKLCIEDEIRRQKVGPVTEEEIESVLDELEYYKNRFSTSGCKRVLDRVAVLKYKKLNDEL